MLLAILDCVETCFIFARGSGGRRDPIATVPEPPVLTPTWWRRRRGSVVKSDDGVGAIKTEWRVRRRMPCAAGQNRLKGNHTPENRLRVGRVFQLVLASTEREQQDRNRKQQTCGSYKPAPQAIDFLRFGRPTPTPQMCWWFGAQRLGHADTANLGRPLSPPSAIRAISGRLRAESPSPRRGRFPLGGFRMDQQRLGRD